MPYKFSCHLPQEPCCLSLYHCNFFSVCDAKASVPCVFIKKLTMPDCPEHLWAVSLWALETGMTLEYREELSC